MKKSSTALLCLAVFFLGFVAGLAWAAFKGTPNLTDADSQATRDRGTPSAVIDDVETDLALLKKKMTEDPGRVDLYLEAGRLLFSHEQFEEAASYFEQALELGRKDPDILTETGICYRNTGQPEKAAAYFRQARELDPSHGTSALYLGIVLFHDLQDRAGAVAAWQDYLALNPQGPRAEMIRRVLSQIGPGPEQSELVKRGTN